MNKSRPSKQDASSPLPQSVSAGKSGIHRSYHEASTTLGSHRRAFSSRTKKDPTRYLLSTVSSRRISSSSSKSNSHSNNNNLNMIQKGALRIGNDGVVRKDDRYSYFHSGGSESRNRHRPASLRPMERHPASKHFSPMFEEHDHDNYDENVVNSSSSGGGEHNNDTLNQRNGNQDQWYVSPYVVSGEIDVEKQKDTLSSKLSLSKHSKINNVDNVQSSSSKVHDLRNQINNLWKMKSNISISIIRMPRRTRGMLCAIIPLILFGWSLFEDVSLLSEEQFNPLDYSANTVTTIQHTIPNNNDMVEKDNINSHSDISNLPSEKYGDNGDESHPMAVKFETENMIPNDTSLHTSSHMKDKLSVLGKTKGSTNTAGQQIIFSASKESSGIQRDTDNTILVDRKHIIKEVETNDIIHSNDNTHLSNEEEIDLFEFKERNSGLKQYPGIPLPNQQNLISPFFSANDEGHGFLSAKMILGKMKRRYKPTQQLLQRVKTMPHTNAGLHCTLYGGPDTSTSNDNVYWNYIESDYKFKSPHYIDPHYVYDDDDTTDEHKMETKEELNVEENGQTAEERRKLSRNNHYDDDSPILADKGRNSKTKYLTFQPDVAGFNNNRLAFETLLVLSAAMGRTLVLPPKHQIPLLDNGNVAQNLLSFDDFFHLDTLNRHYDGVNIISMEEFLVREAVHGRLKQFNGTNILLPPDNITNWDQSDNSHDNVKNVSLLWNYIHEISYVASSWQPNKCVAAFPSLNTKGGTLDGNRRLLELIHDILTSKDGRPKPLPHEFQGRPVPVNAPPIERLREVLAGRGELCLYRNIMRDASVVHFTQDITGNSVQGQSQLKGATRLLTQHYSFVFFEDWRQATWSSRLIRDSLRYTDEIMCAASRVIDAIRQSAYSHENSQGSFDALHVRRNDFPNKYGIDKLTAENIVSILSSYHSSMNKQLKNYTNTTDIALDATDNTLNTTETSTLDIDEDGNSIQNRTNVWTIFVATDENDESFFLPLQKAGYNLLFLSDFEKILSGMNPNLNGMVEQIVASKARNFWGTYYSSFSGQIMRLRGYHYVNDDNADMHSGKIASSYYLQDEYRNVMRLYRSPSQPFFAREFPLAWRDIDRGIGEMTWEGW